jgi:ApaG protein
MTAMYSKTTREITVTVRPMYLPVQSVPDKNRFIWAYQVLIENNGPETVQLLNRSWRITDGLGQVREVSGPGVLGEQPVLAPGTKYEYTSGTPLNTPSGIMVGSYQMETTTGERFDVEIPAFSLDSPHQPISLH